MPFANSGASQQESERQPLLKSLSPSTTGSLCSGLVILGLVIAWCMNDFWQRALNSDLFNVTHTQVTAQGPVFHFFAYPLTLAFVGFLFTGLLFSAMYAAFVMEGVGAEQILATTFAPDRYWTTMVASHVCGTFWLQSLMMPSQMMSLGLFAVSRAADIPMVSAMRSSVFGSTVGKKQLRTTGLAFAAACIMFYSYAQLSGCVCIWSGNGVALTGLAFWVVYFLILALPAANAVCQETILVQREAHPVTILAVQNLCACLLFLPVVIVAHVTGWEDVGEAVSMIFARGHTLLTVMWLCVAMAATEGVSTLLISMSNSFWAVALRALRVVIWGGQMLALYSMGSPLPLSIACPHSSLWALILTGGTLLAMAAVYTDAHSREEITAVASKGYSQAEDARKTTGTP